MNDLNEVEQGDYLIIKIGYKVKDFGYPDYLTVCKKATKTKIITQEGCKFSKANGYYDGKAKMYIVRATVGDVMEFQDDQEKQELQALFELEASYRPKNTPIKRIMDAVFYRLEHEDGELI